MLLSFRSDGVARRRAGSDQIALFGRLNFPSLWRVHLQGLMDAVVIVVLEVLLQNPTEMSFAEDDNLVQTFSADTAV